MATAILLAVSAAVGGFLLYFLVPGKHGSPASRPIVSLHFVGPKITARWSVGKFKVSVNQLTRLLTDAQKAHHKVWGNKEDRYWPAWYARYISRAVRFESGQLFDPGSTSNIIEESGEVHPAFTVGTAQPLCLSASETKGPLRHDDEAGEKRNHSASSQRMAG